MIEKRREKLEEKKRIGRKRNKKIKILINLEREEKMNIIEKKRSKRRKKEMRK